MSNLNGVITSYDELMNKVNVSEIFKEMLPQYDMILGFINQGSEITSTKYEWWLDKALPNGTTLGANYTAATSDDITVANVAGIRVGSILKVGTAILRATAINSTTKVVDVVKIEAGADATTGDTVDFIGVGVIEGTTYVDSDSIQKEKVYNVTQIFEDFISFTKTQLNVEQEVNIDVFLLELKKKMDRLAKQMNRTIWHGVRVAPSDNTAPRLLGGVQYLVNEHGGYKPSATAFTVDNFDEFVRVARNTHNNASNEIWMNSTTYKKFTALDTTLIRLENLDTVRSGRRVQTYLTKFGDVLTINRDEDIPNNHIYLLNSSDLYWRPLRGDELSTAPVGADDRLKKWHISGQYTLEVQELNTISRFICS